MPLPCGIKYLSKRFFIPGKSLWQFGSAFVLVVDPAQIGLGYYCPHT